MDVSKPIKRRMKIKREGGNWSWINFKYERLGTFCFVCGRLGHSERECNVVYANPNKEIERAYGTWLRAPNKNTRVNTGSRWLRNGEGGSKWEEHGGYSKFPAAGDEMGKEGARFKEDGDSVAKNREDNGRITITAPNQEPKDNVGHFLNEEILNEENNGGGNYVIDPKRRRTEKEIISNENGPTNMQTDGLIQLENSGNFNGSKNLNVAGSVEEARLGL